MDDEVQSALQALQSALQQLQESTTPSASPDAPVAAAGQLARLEAARQAVALAPSLLGEIDPRSAGALRSGRGWFEDRVIRRKGRRVVAGPDSKPMTVTVERRYGPYRDLRWRDERGQQHSRYLGRVDQLKGDRQPGPGQEGDFPLLPPRVAQARQTGGSDVPIVE